MNLSFFKFFLKKGLSFPRNEEELDYVKENVFKDKEKPATPSFEKTWNYIIDDQSTETSKETNPISGSIDYEMSQAARFGGKIDEETKREMEKDKKEAKEKM